MNPAPTVLRQRIADAIRVAEMTEASAMIVFGRGERGTGGVTALYLPGIGGRCVWRRGEP